MKRTTVFLGTVLILLFGIECRADGFVFEVESPKFHISLPSMPTMKMDVHPLHAKQPHIRYMGSSGPYTISVITPAAAEGMTPLECAAATVRTLPGRSGGPSDGRIYKARLDKDTFVAIYATPLDGVVRLNAHVLSAAGGKHCIEVHASKMSDSDGDLAAWIDGFEKSRIEPGK